MSASGGLGLRLIDNPIGYRIYKFRATELDCGEGGKKQMIKPKKKTAGRTRRCAVSNRWQASQKSGAGKVSNTDGCRYG